MRLGQSLGNQINQTQGLQVPCEQSHHVRIDGAICALEDSVAALDNLLAMIRAEPQQDQVSCQVRGAPSFHDVLTGSPERIRTANEMILDRVNLIRTLLF